MWEVGGVEVCVKKTGKKVTSSKNYLAPKQATKKLPKQKKKL